MKAIKILMTITIKLIVCKSLIYAQEIVTDRPGQSNTPALIPPGAFQVETGFILEEDRLGGNRTVNYTYNSTLLKLGVNNNFEGRINFCYLGLHHVDDNTPVSKGPGPVSLGAKIKLAEENGVAKTLKRFGYMPLHWLLHLTTRWECSLKHIAFFLNDIHLIIELMLALLTGSI
jgi:hypothetical protein